VIVGVACSGLTSSAIACLGTSSPPQSDAGRDGATDGHFDGAPDSAKDRGAATDSPDPADAGGPYLTELSVASSTDSSAPVRLTPAFSPKIHDYYVRCASGANDVTVTMGASSGAKSRLVQPKKSPPLARQTLAVSVEENDAIVAIAEEGTTSTEYWVRCLPADFPILRWTAHPERGTPPAGYYLLDSAQLTPGGAYALVLDSHGVPVWYLHSKRSPTNVDEIVPGAISFLPTPDEPMNLPWEIHALADGGVMHVSAPWLSAHELRHLDGGHFLSLAIPTVRGVDLTGYDVPLPDGGVMSFGPDASYDDCEIVEVDPLSNSVVWAWSASDHLDPVRDSTWPQLVSSKSPIPDPYHCNSIDVDPTNGNLLVSVRHADSLLYIERTTGRILWKLGGSAFTKDDATYVPVPDAFLRQHDARILSWAPICGGGTGEISVFDDHTAGDASERAAIYRVDVTPEGGGPLDCGVIVDAGPTGATLTWQYKGYEPSPGLGSFRVLADGSRTICWGYGTNAGSDTVTFLEVDEAGRDLIDVSTGYASYRTVKVPLDAFDLSVLRRTAGHP
jgi:hypothetical protein